MSYEEELEKKAERQDFQIESMAKTIYSLERQLTEEKCESETLEVILSRVSREDLEKAQRISEMTKVIESKEMAIRSLRDLHRSDKRSIKSLVKQCGWKDQRVSDLEKEIEEKDRAIKALNKMCSELKDYGETNYKKMNHLKDEEIKKKELRISELERAGQEMAANYQAMADKLTACREELRKKTYDLEYFQELFNEEHEKLKIIADQRDQGKCDLDQMREAYQTVAEQLKEAKKKIEALEVMNSHLKELLKDHRVLIID